MLRFLRLMPVLFLLPLTSGATVPENVLCADQLRGTPPAGHQSLQSPSIQEKIWDLFDSGRWAEAMELEGKIRRLLSQAPALTAGAAGGRPDVDYITFRGGVTAVRKIRNDAELIQREVLIYELDKALGFRFHVPLTVERKGDSAQLFVPNIGTEPPGGIQPGLPMELWILDMLTGNWDRSSHHNLVYTASGRFVAIDNERAEFLTRDLNFEKSRVADEINARFLNQNLNLHINPLLNVRIYDGPFRRTPAELTDLKNFLEREGYDQIRFRKFVSELDEATFISVLGNKISPTALKLVLSTLHLFRQV